MWQPEDPITLLLPPMRWTSCSEPHCGKLDLEGCSWCGDKQRKMLICWLDSLPRIVAARPALHGLVQCGTTSTVQVVEKEAMASWLHALQRPMMGSPTWLGVRNRQFQLTTAQAVRDYGVLTCMHCRLVMVVLHGDQRTKVVVLVDWMCSCCYA